MKDLLPSVKPPVPDNPETESTRSRVSDAEKELAEIQGFLNRWRTSTIDGNVDAQTILYAPRMDHYFRQRNVSRATVRREKARMKELYPTVNRYDISDVRVESAEKEPGCRDIPERLGYARRPPVRRR